MTTINDIARIAGVSISTVSHVMHGTKHVSDDTRSRVEAAIDEAGFVPNVGAQSLRNGRTRTIGLVASDVSQYFFSTLIAEIEHEARADGLTLVLANSGEDQNRERAAVRAFLDRRVDGLIVAPVAGSDRDIVDMCRAAACPVVFVDRVKDASQDRVGIDNRSTMGALTQHLIDAGHHRIALVAGDPEVWTLSQRISGFLSAIAASDERSDPLIITTEHGLGDGQDEVRAAFAQSRRPTALIAASAPLTIGALRALRDLDLRIPEDVAFESFDGVLNSEFFAAQLTCVVQPAEEIGAQAMRLLRRRMKDLEADPITVAAAASFVHGTSCGCGGLVPLKPPDAPVRSSSDHV